MKSETINRGNAYSSKLNYIVTNRVQIKYEIYSFIGIVENYFSLQPILVERIKYVLNEIWNQHTMFFNRIRYENCILGVMLFAQDEFYREMKIDYISTDVTKFVAYLYKEKDIHRNLIQIYTVFQTVTDIFKKPLYSA